MRNTNNIYYHVEELENANRLRNGELLTKEHLIDDKPLFLSRSDHDWWPGHLPDADKNFRLYEIELEPLKPLVFTSSGTGREHFNNDYFKLFNITGGDYKNICSSEYYQEEHESEGIDFFELVSTIGELGECLLYNSSKYVKSIKLIRGPKPKSPKEEIETKIALADLLEVGVEEVAEPDEHVQEAFMRHPTGDLSEEDVVVMYSDPKDCTDEGLLLKVSFRVSGQVKYTNPEETNQEFLDKVLITDEPELKKSNWCNELYDKYHLNLLTKGGYKGGTLYVLLDPQVSIVFIEEIEET